MPLRATACTRPRHRPPSTTRTRPRSHTHTAGASQLGTTDWFSLASKWLRRAFPAAKLEFHNGCVPATPAAFMTLCLEHYLDPLADLVFVEVRISTS